MEDVILAPLDGSDLAEHALPYAAWLARTLGAALRLLFVVAPSDGEHDDTLVPPAHEPDLELTRRESMGRYLEDRAAALRAAGLRTASAMVVDDPHRSLRTAAEAADVRAVVLATHGRGGLHALLLGSVAHALLRTCPHPVLVVAARESAPDPAAVTVRRLLVPLDGTAHAEAALPVASDLARTCWAPLTLVRVVPVLPRPVSAPFPGMRTHAQEGRHLSGEASAYLRETRQRLSASVEVETLVARGDAGQQLVAMLQEDDLVVLTSRRRGDLARTLLGSVADRLIRAGVPVLAVPPGDESEPARLVPD